MALTLTFHGGARAVTGANYLLETDRAKILIDCGLNQGCHFCEGMNRRDFSYDPASIDAVVVTHAHIDHTGRLPKLVRDGYKGKFFATPATRDIAALLLADSAKIIAEEAKERGEEPIYLPRDVPRAVKRFAAVEYHEPYEVADGVTATLFDAGHVLGSAVVVLEVEGKKIVFSGDIGNPPSPLLKPTETVAAADYVLIEAVYGDRIHEDRDERRAKLKEVVESTISRGGTLIIPTFAFGRTQGLLAELNAFVEGGEIPKVPVFVDSPLATKITAVYQKYPKYYNERAQAEIVSGDVPFRFPGLTFTRSVAESKRINNVKPPKIIIAGSGMMQGGRILHHAIRYLRDPNSTLLIFGYQAAGSLGRRLLAHARTVRIFRKQVSVRARIKAIGGYSAHADQEALLAWLGAISPSPQKTFVVQGEEAASMALKHEIREQLGFDAVVPIAGEQVELV